jgi:hypothetical protein
LIILGGFGCRKLKKEYNEIGSATMNLVLQCQRPTGVKAGVFPELQLPDTTSARSALTKTRTRR